MINKRTHIPIILGLWHTERCCATFPVCVPQTGVSECFFKLKHPEFTTNILLPVFSKHFALPITHPKIVSFQMPKPALWRFVLFREGIA